MYTDHFVSPLICLLIDHDGQRIHAVRAVGLGVDDTALAHTAPLADHQPHWHEQLMRYVEGELQTLESLPLRLQGTAFQQAVWQALRQIPAGQTRTYAQLARSIDRPQAARAVGQALRHNPLLLLVPCHRVIQSSGALGGFAGRQPTGVALKAALLRHEGAMQFHQKSPTVPADKRR